MLNHISANDLKTRGISAVEAMFSDGIEEAIITVHGKAKFVMIPMETYDHYRECELSVALEDARKAYAEGRFTTGSVEEHMARLRSLCSK